MSELSHLGAYRLIHQGYLTEAERFALSNHLQECAACRQHAIMAGVLSNHFVLEASSARPSPQFTAVYMESAARRSRRSHIMKPIYAVGGLAALALLMLAGWFIIRTNFQTTGLVEAPQVPAVNVSGPQVEPQPEVVEPPPEIDVAVLNENLVAAVADKDAAEVERLLIAGARADARNSSGNSILQQAIQGVRFSGNIDIAALLVNNGADVNAPDQYGNALLPQAAGAGQLEIVQLLLEAGADVNGTVRAGSTKGSWLIPGVNESALSEAAINNHVEIVELLIAYGADVDHAEDGLSRTALHYASFLINPEVIKILLENGADPDLPSDMNNGETALHFAVERGSSIAARALLDGRADVNVQTELGMTPMMVALIDHNSEGEITTMFLEYGADPNIVESNGNTALHFAAQEGRTFDIPILLEHGADVNQQNRIGNTALHQTARWNQTEAVSILLEYGASLDLKNNKDQTPLDVATNDEIIEMLREVGVGE